MHVNEMGNVREGQVWSDNDKRAAGRMVRVDRIDGEHADCTIVADRFNPQKLNGKYMTNRPAGWTPVGLETRILLRRFAPTSTGYRLQPQADWDRHAAVVRRATPTNALHS